MRVGIISALFMAAMAVPALAQDDVETLGQDKKDRTPRPSALGPLTVVKPAGLLIASFDSNNDYKITRTEFEIGANTAFTQADLSGDGDLTLFELEDWREHALGSLDAMPGNLSFDTNYNSRVTKAEFMEVLSFEFDSADKDEDGIVGFGDLIRFVERPRRVERDTERDQADRFLEQNRRQRR